MLPVRSMLLCLKDQSVVFSASCVCFWAKEAQLIPHTVQLCRFHPENQNYVTVGSALGSVLAMNSSTGTLCQCR